MAQNIIAIIGARKTGKSQTVDLLQGALPAYTRTTPDVYSLIDFLKLHEMSVEEYYHVTHYEENRKLFFLYKELQFQLNPHKYLQLFLNELDTLDKVIIDNIYTYSDLAALIKLKAKVLLLEAPLQKRQDFGYKPGMDQEFYTQEVASITSKDVKSWSDTFIVTNNSSIHDLRLALYKIL